MCVIVRLIVQAESEEASETANGARAGHGAEGGSAAQASARAARRMGLLQDGKVAQVLNCYGLERANHYPYLVIFTWNPPRRMLLR